MLTPEQAERLASDLFDDDATDAEPVEPAAVPARIAGYRIIRVIASGGMGTVYEAQQEHPHRTVALKVLRSGLTSRSTLKRFHYEAEVLGHLQHPGIAQVYDAGTHDDGAGGVPYFVMELIPGARPITTYADDHGLTIRQRLELFTQVCDAVHYGHQKGIIHRDLKPANILVADETAARAGDGGSVSRRFVDDSTAATAPSGGQSSGGRPSGGFSSSESQEIEPATVEGEGAAARAGDGDGDVKPADARANGAKPTPAAMPTSGGGVKVIDFGIARATNSDITLTTMQTDARHLLGTLQYMSPEQAIGNAADLDMRSDVYSLGVVLYELLCGRLPYDLSDSSIPHATRQIQEAEPPHPSTMSRSLRGDVGTIVLKALEKDRTKRYQSVADLCRDIQHYLTGEPIEARPPGAWMKSVRWVGRHPVLSTAALCIVMIAGGFITTQIEVWYLRKKPHELIVSEDHKAARLMSAGGKVLQEWDSGYERGIPFAAWIRLDVGEEPDDLVVIGRSAVKGFTSDAPPIAAYDTQGDLVTPEWTDRLSRADVPTSLLRRGRDELGFHPAFGTVADVFSDKLNPGPEIVAVYQNYFSQCAVRVLSARTGRVLYQFWHDGNLWKPTWLEDAGLLVLAGVNGEVFGPQRGFRQPQGTGNHPAIVLALRPRFGYLSTDFIKTESTVAGDTLEWYRCLLPQDVALQFALRIHPAFAGEDEGCQSRLAVELFRDTRFAFSMLLDANGQEVADKRAIGNHWTINPPIPDHNVLYLGELPPVLKRTSEAMSTDE